MPHAPKHLVIRAQQLVWSKLQAQRSRWRPAQRVLFSPRTDWEGSLRDGFQPTHHQITFLPLSEASSRNVDIVVPLTIEDVRLLARRPDLATPQRMPIPTEAVIDLCDDKLALNLHLQSLGFGAHIPTMGPASRPPFMLKKRVDEFGKSCVILTEAIHRNAPWLAHPRPEEILQEFVPGPTEHAYHAFMRDGRIEWSLNIQYDFATDLPIKGRDSPLLCHVTSPRHLALWESMLRAINYHGLCCINFKESERGPQLLEINPRCGGSLARYFFLLVDHVSRDTP